MRQNIKTKKPLNRRAISLALCFSVIVMASIFTLKANVDKLKNLTSGEPQLQSQIQLPEKPVSKKIPTVDSNQSKNEKESSEGTDTSQIKPWISPLSDVTGSTGLEFSPDYPVYSKTLDQFMVHNGIDICAQENSRVQAIASGTVILAEPVDGFGYTVTINHGNGFTSTYSNLSEDITVETGDVVKQGDMIGSISNTAIFESLEDPHLHLEMTFGGKLVNPCDYIQFQ